MAFPVLNKVQISGLSAAGFKRLTEQIGHLGLDVVAAGNELNVTGPNLAGSLGYDPATETLTVQMHEPALWHGPKRPAQFARCRRIAAGVPE